MPMDLWKDIAGYACVQCGGPATHFYDDDPICCDCHVGRGAGLVTREEAQAWHDYLLRGEVSPLIADYVGRQS